MGLVHSRLRYLVERAMEHFSASALRTISHLQVVVSPRQRGETTKFLKKIAEWITVGGMSTGPTNLSPVLTPAQGRPTGSGAGPGAPVAPPTPPPPAAAAGMHAGTSQVLSSGCQNLLPRNESSAQDGGRGGDRAAAPARLGAHVPRGGGRRPV